MPENRVYRFLPTRLKTPHNRRSMAVTDDVLFEPEDFEDVEGQIGDPAGLSDQQLAREPFVPERDAEREAYQLSVAVTSRIGGEATGDISTVAFYTDLVRQVANNGGDVSDHGRLFGSEWSAWTPPFDYDRWVNYGKYHWTGPGDARVQGEYITKDPEGSQTVFYRVDGSQVTRVVAGISDVAKASFPAGSSVGQLMEDGTDSSRRVYRWDGSAWQLLNWVQSASVPKTGTGLKNGQHYYVPSSTHLGNRPVFYEYSEAAGRWLCRVPIVSPSEPMRAPVGAMWEDSRNPPHRKLYKKTQAGWDQVTWSAVTTMVGTGVGSDGDVKYHALSLESVTDGWAANSWWRHYDDLSDADRDVTAGKQAVRPIVQFWSGLEAWPGDSRSFRHDEPRFEVYAYYPVGSSLQKLSGSTWQGNTLQSAGGCKLVSYTRGAGQDDPIIGFPLSTNNTGEFSFTLNLEADVADDSSGDPVPGYRYFRDSHTGLFKTVWSPAETSLRTEKRDDGVWEVPRNLTDNPDHAVMSSFSRSEALSHFISVLEPHGLPLGNNGYRWSDNDPVTGATAIDPHSSLLRVMSMLQDTDLDFPEAIRVMSREMSRLRSKFTSALKRVWDSGQYSNPDDTLKSGVTASDVVDEILTTVLVGRDSNSAFWYSDMGTYVDTVTGETKPITFPPSVARTGACPAFEPSVLPDGSLQLHDGAIAPGYGDDRDAVVLELENRFFSRVPEFRRTETESSSARLDSVWVSGRYYGNSSWFPDYEVDSVVSDYAALTPSVGDRVFSRSQALVAEWTGSAWVTEVPPLGSRVEDSSGNKWHYNGFGLASVALHSRQVDFDYTVDEYYSVMKREFDRWSINRGVDPAVNDAYDPDDEFTWNFSAAGVEGNWRGIYRRIYGTTRPHTHPWEVCGFTLEPEWWRDTWTPTSTASDGSPRYSSSHDMWDDIKSANSFPVSVETGMLMSLTAPPPVDSDGELVGPVTAGLISDDDVPEMSRSGRWVYGDCSPAEHEFFTSTEGVFARALAGFVTKPARFVESLWSDYVRPIGTPSTVWRGPIIVDVNTWRRSSISESTVHMDVSSDGSVVTNPGVNSWVSETVRYFGGDPSSKFGDRVRSASVNLAWRAAGFVNKNRTVLRTPSGVEVPYEDVFTVTHYSLPREVKFHSGVNIIRDGTGYRMYGYDTARPFFTVSLPAVPSKSGVVTLEEEFTATDGQSDFLLTKFSLGDNDVSRFSVLVDGKAVAERGITRDGNRFQLSYPARAGQVVTAQLVTRTGNPATGSRFLEVAGKRFEYYTSGSGETASYPYGQYFESNSDVVRALVDHGRWMSEQGWEYEDPDEPSGPQNDWLAVAARFAAWSEVGRETGDIFVDVPSGEALRLSVDFGNLMSVERVSDGSYSVLDVAGSPLRPEALTVHRLSDRVSVRTLNSENEIYGLRVGINEVEHAVVISNKTKFNDLIYDPVTGLRQKRLSLKAYRSRSWAGRYEAPGYVIDGSDLIPGFDKMAKDFTRYYDRLNPVDDPDVMMQAHNLYGYRRRPYLDDLGASPLVSLDYHRALLKYKGTSRPLAAFFAGTTAGDASAGASEVWAWRVGEFGEVGHRSYCSFAVTEDEVRDVRQVVEFVDQPGDGSVIEVLTLDRSDVQADTRWVTAPSSGSFSFPVSGDRVVTGDLYHRMNLLENGEVLASFFHWNPAAGLHDPAAYSNVDFETAVDPASYNSDSQELNPWGAERVGTLWWDTTNLSYSDYESLPSPRDRAREWGQLSHTPVTLTSLGIGSVVCTVESHEFEVGQVVRVKVAEGPVLTGEVGAVTDTTVTLQSSDPTDPDSIGVVDSRSVVGSGVEWLSTSEVVVCEWVESDVEPDQYSTFYDDGEPAGDEYTVVVRPDNTVRYYFWLRGGTSVPPGKTMAASDVERYLESPSSLSRWFAPLGARSFAFYTPGIKVSDSAVVELLTDRRGASQHTQWALVSESSSTERVADAVVGKLLDSLYGA